MRRTRSMLAVALVGGLFILLSPDAAWAGGWDSIEPKRDHYLPGQTAVLRGRFASNHLKGSGRIEGGPYYAYLLPPSGGGFALIDPPTIPEGAISLGVLRFGALSREDDGWLYATARLTFTVPDVPSGHYPVSFCNDPCRSSTIGWLGGGGIRIVHTALEARLMDRNALLESRLRGMRLALRRSEKQAEALIERVDKAKASQGALQAQVAAMTDRLRTASKPAPAGSPVPTWAAVAAIVALLLLALAVASRRPRSRRNVRPVTDTSPNELDELPRVLAGSLRRLRSPGDRCRAQDPAELATRSHP